MSSDWSKGLTAETKALIFEEMKREGVAEAMKERVREQVRTLMRDKGVDAAIRDLIRGAALEVAREVLAESLGELEVRVRKHVLEMFDARVEAEAKRLLDDALTAVRKKMAP